jgi:hypothetical protein
MKEIAYVMPGPTEKSNNWVLDSGAGSHATSDKSLIKKDPYTPKIILRMANGSETEVTVVGKVDVPLDEANLTLF